MVEWYRWEQCSQAVPSGLYSDHTSVLLWSNTLKQMAYRQYNIGLERKESITNL